MNIIFGIMIVAFALTIGWIMADMVIPQSEIDEIDAIGRWAKEELERRDAERRTE